LSHEEYQKGRLQAMGEVMKRYNFFKNHARLLARQGFLMLF
jgi:hypothetical protein